MPVSAEICVNCGATRPSEYCAACGERRLDRDNLKLSAFASSALEEITDLEHSKLLQTLKILFLRPGVLTNEYLQGRRKSYLGPIKIYLTIFAVSFLFYSIYQPTSVYDVRNFLAQDPTGTWHQVIGALEKKTGLSENIAIAEVNARWQRYINLTQAIYPLAIALLLEILYLTSGRYFAEHLIFALHFMAVAFGAMILTWPIFAFIGVQRVSATFLVANVVTVLILGIWLLIALRRVCRQPWFVTSIKTLIGLVGYFFVGMVIALGTLALAFITLSRRH